VQDDVPKISNNLISKMIQLFEFDTAPGTVSNNLSIVIQLFVKVLIEQCCNVLLCIVSFSLILYSFIYLNSLMLYFSYLKNCNIIYCLVVCFLVSV